MKCLVHHESGFDRISLEDIYIFGFHQPPKLQIDPIDLADPNYPTLFVGDHLISTRGKNTSAGFIPITLPIDCSLEYCGTIIMGEFELLCFMFIKLGTRIAPDFSEEYAATYYGWIRMDNKRWFVSNTANSGRVIETTKVTIKAANIAHTSKLCTGKDFTDRQRIKRKAQRWANNYAALPSAEQLAVLSAILDRR